MDFREIIDPDTLNVLITEHWWDDRIQKFRNLAQRAGITIVTAIGVLAPLGTSIFQLVDDTKNM